VRSARADLTSDTSRLGRSAASDATFVATGVVAVAGSPADVGFRRNRGSPRDLVEHMHERFVDADHVATVPATRSHVE